jgi:hypothetical protein
MILSDTSLSRVVLLATTNDPHVALLSVLMAGRGRGVILWWRRISMTRLLCTIRRDIRPKYLSRGMSFCAEQTAFGIRETQ